MLADEYLPHTVLDCKVNDPQPQPRLTKKLRSGMTVGCELLEICWLVKVNLLCLQVSERVRIDNKATKDLTQSPLRKFL